MTISLNAYCTVGQNATIQRPKALQNEVPVSNLSFIFILLLFCVEKLVNIILVKAYFIGNYSGSFNQFGSLVMFRYSDYSVYRIIIYWCIFR